MSGRAWRRLEQAHDSATRQGNIAGSIAVYATHSPGVAACVLAPLYWITQQGLAERATSAGPCAL